MLFIVALIFVSKSCLDEDPKIPGDEESTEPDNEVAIAWNNMAYTIANQHDQFYSFIGVRALGMTHLAIHDALNAISKKYEPYAFKEKEPDADPVAASSQAAYEVLISVYPQREDTLKAELNRWLSAIDDPKAKQLGINLGKKSAAAIVQLREDDGHAANELISLAVNQVPINILLVIQLYGYLILRVSNRSPCNLSASSEPPLHLLYQPLNMQMIIMRLKHLALLTALFGLLIKPIMLTGGQSLESIPGTE
jgi:hypothetical protein